MSLHVLVVDDSAVVRQATTWVLSREPGWTVSVAADPVIALGKMGRGRPDVIVLDLEMPRMDGLTFLRRIMKEDPIPVVVCSGFAERGTDAAIRALEEGAVEVIAKPAIGVRDFLHQSGDRLVEAVRAAAAARPRSNGPVFTAPLMSAATAITPVPGTIVAMGASTGGCEALRHILEALPENAPPHAIVQHMPERFTAAFARRLATTCRVEVKEAEDGDRLVPGRALIAPGNRHLTIRPAGGDFVAVLDDSPPVSRHRPSVNVLFRSVAQSAGKRAVGVILTGMGDDGAEGMASMRRAGAATIAQDERTSVVFGMPQAAIQRGAVLEVLGLPLIPAAILRAAAKRR